MSYDTLNEYVPVETRLRDFLSRHGLRMAGMGTIALSGALLASLITWHVDDPSFSYVVDGGASPACAGRAGRSASVSPGFAEPSCLRPLSPAFRSLAAGRFRPAWAALQET
jgi:hypothetical protein